MLPAWVDTCMPCTACRRPAAISRAQNLINRQTELSAHVVAFSRFLRTKGFVIGPEREADALRAQPRCRLRVDDRLWTGLVALAVGAKGNVAGDPDVQYAGIPARDRNGKPMDDIIDKAIFATIDGLPRAKLRDPDTLANAVERAVRSAVGAAWGKKPLVHVLVVEV